VFLGRGLIIVSVACGMMNAQQAGSPPIAQPAPSAAQGVTPVEPLSVEFYYWFTNAQPVLKGGAANTNITNGSDLEYSGQGHHTPAGIVSIPAGTGNSLRFSYFQNRWHWQYQCAH
jgi:hypothetical protein